MDPWALLEAHPAVTVSVMGVVALAALWAGLAHSTKRDRADAQVVRRHIAELTRLRERVARLARGLSDDLDDN